MTLSFRARLTLRWLSAFGVVLTLALAAVSVGVRAFLERDLDAQLRTLAATELASAVDEPGHGLHLHEFTVRGGQDYADKFVQLITARGVVLMQSPRLRSSPSLLGPETLAQTLGGASPLVEVAVGGRPGRMVGLATAGPERYVVAVGLFTDTLEATLRDLRWLLGGVWIGSMVVTALVGWSLASRALRPVRMITERAAAIAEGQFDTRLAPPDADDEIGRMTGLLNQMLERLRGALDANRRFAADASHELRSPLTVMLGEVDVALKREREGDEYRRVLTEVRTRLHEMGRLTEDLMLLVRAQENVAPPITDLPLLGLWREVMARAADGAAAAGVSLSVDVPAAMVVYAEAGLLGRVFDNLVQNAVQYNRDGGAVEVTARVEPGDGTWAADTVVIQVHDTGPGIPAAERERVFERFYRLDSSRSRRTGGAGLGLAISREIVRLFKGRIRIADTAVPGTTVEVRLPGSDVRVEAVSAAGGAAARFPA